jgi:MFS family permease
MNNKMSHSEPSATPSSGITDARSSYEEIKNKKETPLPKGQLFVLFLMQLTEGMAQTQLSPYAPFLILYFGLTDDESDIGYYSGMLTSAWAFAQFLSGFWWGTLSDKIGRRPVLLGGMAGTIIATILFGMSKTFTFALIMRLIHGLLNGNTGIVKTYLAEVTDETNKPKAFVLNGLAASFGRIIGGIVGGLLANPAASYPALFASIWLFTSYPYLLPCLVAAFVSLVGLVTGFVFLKETLKKKQKKAATDHSRSDDLIADQKKRSPRDESEVDKSVELLPLAVEIDASDKKQQKSESEQSDAQIPRTQQQDDNELIEPILQPESKELTETPKSLAQRCCRKLPCFRVRPEALRYLLTTKATCCLVMFTLLVLNFQMFEQAFALLFLGPPEKGGLGFRSDSIGIAQTVTAALLVLYQFFLYPRLTKHFSPLIMFRIGMGGSIPVMMLFPFVALFHSYRVIAWGILLTAMFIRWCLGNSAFTSLNILISNSAPSEYLGSINGLNQSFGAAARTIGNSKKKSDHMSDSEKTITICRKDDVALTSR